MTNSLLPRVTLFCVKNTGPPSSSFMQSAVISITGDVIISIRSEMKISVKRLIILCSIVMQILSDAIRGVSNI